MQQRSQVVVVAVIAAVVIGGLALFAILNRGPDTGALTGRTWQLAAITGQTPAFQGVFPPEEQSLYTIEFATDGDLRRQGGLQCRGRDLRAERQRRHDHHARREHARGLPGRVVRHDLRPRARERDDLGDRQR